MGNPSNRLLMNIFQDTLSGIRCIKSHTINDIIGGYLPLKCMMLNKLTKISGGG